MFCNKCGSQLPPNSKFCNNCGAPVNAGMSAVKKIAIVALCICVAAGATVGAVWAVRKMMTAADKPSKTVSAAENTASVPETEDFTVAAGNYTFASGAGGWSTDITVNADGTFAGTFHDNDYIEEDGCVAQIMFAEFTGKFENIEKVNDYTYSFKVKSLEYKQPIDKEEIIEEDYGKVKYVYSDAYGLAKAKTVYLFTKGAPVNELPEEFVNWARYPLALPEDASTLPFKGLYNVDEQYGFVGE